MRRCHEILGGFGVYGFGSFFNSASAAGLEAELALGRLLGIRHADGGEALARVPAADRRLHVLLQVFAIKERTGAARAAEAALVALLAALPQARALSSLELVAVVDEHVVLLAWRLAIEQQLHGQGRPRHGRRADLRGAGGICARAKSRPTKIARRPAPCQSCGARLWANLAK